MVNYETLVNAPDVEAEKIINFCQLPWQAQCLSIEKNTSAVATASAGQIREPINNRSVGNWQHYQHYLNEVIAILQQAGITP